MSILLDSLKKSEAQRARGHGPSIYSDGYERHVGDSNGSLAMWLMLGVAAIAITWFGSQQYARVDVAAAEAPVEQIARAEGEQPSNSVPANESGEASRTPVEKFENPEDVDPGVMPANPSDDPEFATLSPAESVASYTPPLVGEDSGEIPDSTEIDDSLAPEEQAAEPMEDLERFAADTDYRTPGNDPLSYWVLPQSIRNTLPEFKIMVLVFSDTPEERFILMNGERMREQDSVEDGVILDEIRRDGAVFTYRQYRFMVSN